LDAFVTATANLEVAGNEMLKHPSQANIDAFLTKSADLGTAVEGLKDKIDPELHGDIKTIVGTFEHSANLANILSSSDGEGDSERVDKMIAVAVLKLDALSSLINDAVESKVAETDMVKVAIA
jgi:hypothetical protein